MWFVKNEFKNSTNDFWILYKTVGSTQESLRTKSHILQLGEFRLSSNNPKPQCTTDWHTESTQRKMRASKRVNSNRKTQLLIAANWGALKNLDQSFSMGSQWDKIGKYGQKQVDLVVFSGRNLQSPGYWLLNYNNTHEALLI